MEHATRPWKVGKDMFAAIHVYDSGGDRLTNDRMCGSEGWEDTARLIAAAPKLREALTEIADLGCLCAVGPDGEILRPEMRCEACIARKALNNI